MYLSIAVTGSPECVVLAPVLEYVVTSRLYSMVYLFVKVVGFNFQGSKFTLFEMLLLYTSI